MGHGGQSYPLFERQLRQFFGPRGVDLDAQAVVLNLFRAQADVFSWIEGEALRPVGLTHAGFVLLMSLWTIAPLETRSLAAVLGVSKPAVVSAVDTLERRGFVRRVRSKEDRRLVSVELTLAGRKLVERAQRRTHARELDLTSTFTPQEQRTLVRLLRKLGTAAREREERKGAA